MEKEYKANFISTALNAIKYGNVLGFGIAIVAALYCKMFQIEKDFNRILMNSFLIGFFCSYSSVFILGITSKIKITFDEIIISNIFKIRQYSILKVVDTIYEIQKLKYSRSIDKNIYIVEQNIIQTVNCNFLNRKTFEELDTTIKKMATLKYNSLKKEDKQNISNEPKTFYISDTNKPKKRTPEIITVYNQGIKIDDDYFSFDSIEKIYMQSINCPHSNNYYSITIKTQTNKLKYFIRKDKQKEYFEIYDLIAKYAHLKLKNENIIRHYFTL